MLEQFEEPEELCAGARQVFRWHGVGARAERRGILRRIEREREECETGHDRIARELRAQPRADARRLSVLRHGLLCREIAEDKEARDERD